MRSGEFGLKNGPSVTAGVKAAGLVQAGVWPWTGWEVLAGAVEVEPCALAGMTALLQPAKKNTSIIPKIFDRFSFMQV